MTDVLEVEHRQAWLDWRRGGIGASDVAGILGVSPWASPYSVWADKTGRVGDQDATEAMELGLALEPTIAELFHRRTGLYVVGAQSWCEHPGEGWARATLDGSAAESKWSMAVDGLGGFEAKSTSDSPKRWEAEIPTMYQAQIQWQMGVTGHQRTWLAVLHGSFGLKFRVYGPIERDEADIELLFDRCRTFWFEHVVADVAPPTDGHVATTESLKELAALPGERVDLGPDIAAHLALLRILKQRAKELRQDIDVESNVLRAAMGAATEAFVDGEPVATWRSHLETRPDLDLLRAKFPRAIAKYSNTSTVRALRLDKLKEM